MNRASLGRVTAAVLILALLVFEGLLKGPVVLAEEISVASASNFLAPLQLLVAQFESESGHHVVLSSGSSGKFFAQISNGAPYQVFFSADQEKPRLLEERGLAVAGSRFSYAQGTLMLWSKNPALVDELGAVLLSDRYNRLAIANPKLAPYGLAAKETLERLGIYERSRDKLVSGENIAQTYQFVFSENAQLGFVAASQVLDAQTGKIREGSVWAVPEDYYSPILQDAIVLKTGEESVAVSAFVNFVRGDKARALIESFGYSVP